MANAIAARSRTIILSRGNPAMSRNPQAGVSLLELLISLWVIAAAALILSTSLGLLGRMLDRTGTEWNETDFLIDRLTLRRWIEAMPPSGLMTGGPDQVSFVTFVDEPPLSVASPATVRLLQGTEGVVAVLSDVTVNEAPEIRRLRLSPSGTLTIRYFGAVSVGALPAWRDDWPPNAGLPSLIRIEYQIRGQSAPPLTVIPALWATHNEMSLSSPVPPG
jgi:hypothetical protein